MIEITSNIEKYYQMFDSYQLFNNFLKYAIRDEHPQIFVDDENECSLVVLYSFPAYFILGEPHGTNTKEVFSLIKQNSWIIPSSDEWKQPLEEHFKDKIVTHKRVLFNSKTLDINHILQQRKDLPQGLSIVPIEEKHLINGMIHDDVIIRFFTKSDFLENGFGFALMGDDGFCEGFSLTNYPVVGKEVELYFRVGYDSYAEFRSKGLGTTLCTYFIEEALKRGYNPVWDAANDVSSHIAKKLGYVVEKQWHMFHVL